MLAVGELDRSPPSSRPARRPRRRRRRRRSRSPPSVDAGRRSTPSGSGSAAGTRARAGRPRGLFSSPDAASASSAICTFERSGRSLVAVAVAAVVGMVGRDSPRPRRPAARSGSRAPSRSRGAYSGFFARASARIDGATSRSSRARRRGSSRPASAARRARRGPGRSPSAPPSAAARARTSSAPIAIAVMPASGLPGRTEASLVGIALRARNARAALRRPRAPSRGRPPRAAASGLDGAGVRRRRLQRRRGARRARSGCARSRSPCRAGRPTSPPARASRAARRTRARARPRPAGSVSSLERRRVGDPSCPTNASAFASAGLASTRRRTARARRPRARVCARDVRVARAGVGIEPSARWRAARNSSARATNGPSMRWYLRGDSDHARAAPRRSPRRCRRTRRSRGPAPRAASAARGRSRASRSSGAARPGRGAAGADGRDRLRGRRRTGRSAGQILRAAEVASAPPRATSATSVRRSTSMARILVTPARIATGRSHGVARTAGSGSRRAGSSLTAVP